MTASTMPAPDKPGASTIPMSSTDYQALEDARDHALRALAAARASSPQDGDAMTALSMVQDQLSEAARVLCAIKSRARLVTN